MLYGGLEQSILMSIKPGYADEIYSGQKRFELRKIFPRDNVRYVFLIETNGMKKVTGFFEVSKIHTGPVRELWQRVNKKNYDKKRFYRYFEHWDKGHAIEIAEAHKFVNPVTLPEITEIIPTFRIPQGFMWLWKTEQLGRHLLDHAVRDKMGEPRFSLRRICRGEIPLFRKLVLNYVGKFYDDIDNSFVDKIMDCTVDGRDRHGYFTKSKTVFTIMHQGTPIGHTVLTEKKGNSMKTGPTILFEDYRGQGIGTSFRSFLDDYLKAEGYRKVYCTCPDTNLPTMRYLTKSNYRIEAHSFNQYNNRNGELVFGKLLVDRGVRDPVFKRGDYKVDKITRNMLSEAKFRRHFKGAFGRYFFRIDDSFGLSLVRAICDLSPEDMFTKKQKVVFVAHQGNVPHTLLVFSPKRGGVFKLTFVIKSSVAGSIRSTISYALEQLRRDYEVRKVFTSFPVHDKLVYHVFRSLDFGLEGLLTQPYSEGVDFVQLAKFI